MSSITHYDWLARNSLRSFPIVEDSASFPCDILADVRILHPGAASDVLYLKSAWASQILVTLVFGTASTPLASATFRRNAGVVGVRLDPMASGVAGSAACGTAFLEQGSLSLLPGLHEFGTSLPLEARCSIAIPEGFPLTGLRTKTGDILSGQVELVAGTDLIIAQDSLLMDKPTPESTTGLMSTTLTLSLASQAAYASPCAQLVNQSKCGPPIYKINTVVPDESGKIVIEFRGFTSATAIDNLVSLDLMGNPESTCARPTVPAADGSLPGDDPDPDFSFTNIELGDDGPWWDILSSSSTATETTITTRLPFEIPPCSSTSFLVHIAGHVSSTTGINGIHQATFVNSTSFTIPVVGASTGQFGAVNIIPCCNDSGLTSFDLPELAGWCRQGMMDSMFTEDFSKYSDGEPDPDGAPGSLIWLGEELTDRPTGLVRYFGGTWATSSIISNTTMIGKIDDKFFFYLAMPIENTTPSMYAEFPGKPSLGRILLSTLTFWRPSFVPTGTIQRPIKKAYEQNDPQGYCYKVIRPEKSVYQLFVDNFTPGELADSGVSKVLQIRSSAT